MVLKTEVLVVMYADKVVIGRAILKVVRLLTKTARFAWAFTIHINNLD